MKKYLSRARRVTTAAAMTGVIAWPAFTSGAAADPSPEWMVTAAGGEPERAVPGLTVRPEPDRYRLPVQDYRLTATFGNAGGLWSSGHTGLDFAAAEGTPLLAVGAGVVTEVGYDGAYGNKTVIRLEDGTELWYCHQASQSVSVGERVSAGDVVGALGSTGNTTGAHLHLEVRVGGEPIDPERALARWGVAP